MKETKFKVWDVEKQNMFIVDMMTFRSNGDIFKVWPPVHDENTPGILINQTSGILIQYTGLKDKNGVEIYDGDIVTNYHRDIQVVEYSGCQWITKLIKRKTSWWPAQYLHCEYMKWVVIGNIHENPQLLQIDV